MTTFGERVRASQASQPDPEVRAAAERLQTENDALRVELLETRRWTVETGRHRDRLIEALIGLAMRQFRADGSYCWCDDPVLDPAQHQHDPACRLARAALAGPPTPEASGPAAPAPRRATPPAAR